MPTAQLLALLQGYKTYAIGIGLCGFAAYSWWNQTMDTEAAVTVAMLGIGMLTQRSGTKTDTDKLRAELLEILNAVKPTEPKL